MPTLGQPTLDQLRVFLAVVQAGSFSAASRALNRRQSVVSYTIATLEEQLGGLMLFDRSRRRPVLTEAGTAVLAEARKLAAGADELRARVQGMLQGLEPEVSLAVDVMLPTAHLVGVLAAFRAAFPTVGLRLFTESLGSVARLVLDGTCVIGVSGPRMVALDSLVARPLGAVTMVPVAAPGHPLARQAAPVSREEIQRHIQLVLTDRSELTKGHDFAVLSPQTWRLADLGAKHALLVEGLGWGNMPEHSVRDDLAAGRLVHLTIDDLPDHSYGFSAIHRGDAPPGPAGRWLLERLGEPRPSDEPSFRTERSDDPEPGSLGDQGRSTPVPGSATPTRNDGARG